MIHTTSMSSQGTSPSQHLDVLSNLEALWTLSFRVFCFFNGGSIMQAPLITSLTTGEWTQSLAPLPFPEVGLRIGLKVLTLITWLFLWQQPPSSSYLESYKNHVSSINSGMVGRGLLLITKDAPITQEFPSVLEALCQEPGQISNIYVLSHLSWFRTQKSTKWREGRFQCWFGF